MYYMYFVDLTTKTFPKVHLHLFMLMQKRHLQTVVVSLFCVYAVLKLSFYVTRVLFSVAVFLSSFVCDIFKLSLFRYVYSIAAMLKCCKHRGRISQARSEHPRAISRS